MRTVIATLIVSLALSTALQAQTVERFLEPEAANRLGLTQGEYRAVCAAVPRACEISKKNAKFSWTGDRVIRGLNEKEWKAACAAADDKFPVCRLAERENWLKSTKAGKICRESLVWDKPTCEKLAKEDIEKGMTRRMVLASWGEPKTTYSGEWGEEWVYGSANAYLGGRIVYLFFEDGTLKSFGESDYRP